MSTTNRDTTAADAVDRVARGPVVTRTAPTPPPAKPPVPVTPPVADVPAAGHESAAALLRHDSRISALENSASEYKARQHVLVKADELEQALVARDAKLQALTEEVDELGRVRAEEGALLRVLAAQVTDLHHRANQAEAAQVRVHSSQKAGATPLLQLWC